MNLEEVNHQELEDGPTAYIFKEAVYFLKFGNYPARGRWWEESRLLLIFLSLRGISSKGHFATANLMIRTVEIVNIQNRPKNLELFPCFLKCENRLDSLVRCGRR